MIGFSFPCMPKYIKYTLYILPSPFLYSGLVGHEVAIVLDGGSDSKTAASPGKVTCFG